MKLQHLEKFRAMNDENELSMIFVGISSIEKHFSRYLPLYLRIGFAHEFDNLSKDEMHPIIEYEWSDLGLDSKLEDFSD